VSNENLHLSSIDASLDLGLSNVIIENRYLLLIFGNQEQNLSFLKHDQTAGHPDFWLRFLVYNPHIECN
jgi:hypothetical protein